MTSLKIQHHDPADVTALYRHHTGQEKPQDCYVALDIRTGALWADYNAEIGNGVPSDVYHRLTLRWAIPPLTATAANDLLEHVASVAKTVLNGADTEWNGSNLVGVFTPMAEYAIAEIDNELQDLLDEQAANSDVVSGWSAGDFWAYEKDAEVAAEFGLTADSTDADVAVAVRKAEADSLTLAVVPGPVVLLGAKEYLTRIRDELRAEQDEVK